MPAAGRVEVETHPEPANETALVRGAVGDDRSWARRRPGWPTGPARTEGRWGTPGSTTRLLEWPSSGVDGPSRRAARHATRRRKVAQPRFWRAGPSGAEALGRPARSAVVERADQREVEPVRRSRPARRAARPPRHGVEPVEHLLRLGRAALEHLAAEPEHDQPVRALGLEHEPALRDVPRLLELVRGHRLVGDLASARRRSS